MDFPTFLSNLNSVAESPPDDLKDEERLACIEACKQLQEALESPLEAFIRFIFGVLCYSPLLASCLNNELHRHTKG